MSFYRSFLVGRNHNASHVCSPACDASYKVGSPSLVAVIDLLRLIVYFCPLPASAPPNANTQILETVLSACRWDEYLALPQDITPSKTKETNVLLALRALGNMFQVGGLDAIYGGGDWTALVSIVVS